MDNDKHFLLRWNNHHRTLISAFETLLENEAFVDCTLAAEGKFLKAHKVILSACSPYFAALLSQRYDKHPILILKDVKFQELRAMIDYMYRGEMNISQDQMVALYKVAESLQIKGFYDSGEEGNNLTNTQSQANKSDGKQQIPVLPKASGLTTENKKRFLRTDFDGDMPEVSVLPPTLKRRKIKLRRMISIEPNDLLDNRNQYSISSSYSNNQQKQGLTSTTSVLSNSLSNTNNKDTAQNESIEEEITHNKKLSKHCEETVIKQEAEIMIEPKIEDIGFEGLAMDYEILEDLEAGEDSSQVYHRQSDGTNQKSSGEQRKTRKLKESKAKNFVCTLCSRRYNKVSSLNRHVRYECSENPNRISFKCPYCDHITKRRDTLTLHICALHQLTTKERISNGDFIIDDIAKFERLPKYLSKSQPGMDIDISSYEPENMIPSRESWKVSIDEARQCNDLLAKEIMYLWEDVEDESDDEGLLQQNTENDRTDKVSMWLNSAQLDEQMEEDSILLNDSFGPEITSTQSKMSNCSKRKSRVTGF